MTARYALYCAPGRDSPWAAFGANWLERSATFAAYTAAPRRYGFHATLKPPFRLARGASLAALTAALELFCARQSALRVPPLEVAELDGFLALIPRVKDPRIDALAAACVRGLDRFRAPPTPAELERRRSAGLSPREESLLRRWGYPYVMDRFRFHLSLTGDLHGAPPDAVAAMRSAATAAIAPMAGEPLVLDSICIFEEPAPGADFRSVHRARMGQQGRLVYVVGPSGAGKDSLLEWMRVRLPAGSAVRLARRTITRPTNPGSGEDHIAATEAQFDAALARGDFALHWRANGHRYGVGREIEQWMAGGHTVVLNGSREYLGAARAKFPQLESVHVVASPEVLQSRLLRRGREAAEAVKGRLRRNVALGDAARYTAMVIENDGPLEIAGARLAAFVCGGDFRAP